MVDLTGLPNALPQQPLLAVGTARLPLSASGEQTQVLMIELVADRRDGRIVGVATTIALPAYTQLLRRLLSGRRLDEVEEIGRQLCGHLRGPLLRPTIAALRKAVATANEEAAAG